MCAPFQVQNKSHLHLLHNAPQDRNPIPGVRLTHAKGCRYSVLATCRALFQGAFGKKGGQAAGSFRTRKEHDTIIYISALLRKKIKWICCNFYCDRSMYYYNEDVQTSAWQQCDTAPFVGNGPASCMGTEGSFRKPAHDSVLRRPEKIVFFGIAFFTT